MSTSSAERTQRLRGVFEESSRLLAVLQEHRRTLRWVPEPDKADSTVLWSALFEKATLRELERLWGAHIELALKLRQQPTLVNSGNNGASSQEFELIYNQHYAQIGFSRSPERELARVEAVLFLRSREWGNRKKEEIGRRYATSRTRVAHLIEQAEAVLRALTAALNPETGTVAIKESDLPQIDGNAASRVPASRLSSPPRAPVQSLSDSQLPSSNTSMVALDPFALIRVRIISQCLDHYERLTNRPPGDILTLDVTGMATGFRKWPYDTLYQGILVAGARYLAALRRQASGSRIGVRRTFIIDPDRVTEEMIDDLRKTFLLHVRLGLEAAVLYTGSRVPEEVIADIGLFGDQSSFDFGHLEQLDLIDVGPLSNFPQPGESAFRSVKERVYWALNPANVDHFVVTKFEEINEVVADLRQRQKRSRSALKDHGAA